MNLVDITKNQHFVPQVEQRLNAINPLAKRENQRIYSFTVTDRDSYSLNLDSENGVKISNTLSLNDVFSFDVIGKEYRHNFEKLFHKYEASVNENVSSLFSKISVNGADVKDEIINIFTSKFLNFIRNPYSIKKVINTFPTLKKYQPTDPAHLSNFKKVMSGSKPQKKAYLQ